MFFEFMVISCLLSVFYTMLKRRASKRFVLAESGEETVSWDSTLDNDNSNADNRTNEHVNSLLSMSQGQSLDSGIK